MNFLIVEALCNLYLYYGESFKIECPTGSGRGMNLYEVAQEISRRLCGIFLKDENGRRPLNGGMKLFATDPHWRDLVLFYEYFHGDNGAGLGLHLKGTQSAHSVLYPRGEEAYTARKKAS